MLLEQDKIISQVKWIVKLVQFFRVKSKLIKLMKKELYVMKHTIK